MIQAWFLISNKKRKCGAIIKYKLKQSGKKCQKIEGMKVGAPARGREELSEGGWGGEEERKGALCCGAVPSWIRFQDGHIKGQGTELAPPSGILSQDLSRLPTSLLPSTGSHMAPSPYEARNKEWLLISWNTWDHRGVGKGRGKLRFSVD